MQRQVSKVMIDGDMLPRVSDDDEMELERNMKLIFGCVF